MILATKAAIAHAGAVPVLDYRWVAVGGGGKLYTSDSTTGSSWTQRTSSFSTSSIYKVASNSSTLYVAVGESGKLASSPDGITWTQRTSTFSTTDIYSVCYGDNLWVAVGGSGKLATSPDGITWTARTSSFSTSAIYGVFYDGNYYVAVGQSGKLATSSDGITWTQRTDTVSGSGDIVCKASGISAWMAGHDAGTTGALQSATNPTSTWTSRNSPVGLLDFSQGRATSSSNLYLIVEPNSFFAKPNLYTSSDAATWTQRTPASTAAVGAYAAVAYDNDGTFLYGTQTSATIPLQWSIDSSSNATSWTNRATITVSGSPGELYDICHSTGAEALY